MNDHPSNDMLQAYLDNELANRERLDLELHLQTCADCASELSRLQTLFLAIESIPSEPLSVDLAPEVQRAIRPGIPSLALGELVAAGVLAAGLVAWLGSAELQSRMDDAIQRLIVQFEITTIAVSGALSDLLDLVPDVEKLDLPQLGDLAGSLLFSPSIWWGVAGAAIVLWLVSNGLLLRIGKDKNA